MLLFDLWRTFFLEGDDVLNCTILVSCNMDCAETLTALVRAIIITNINILLHRIQSELTCVKYISFHKLSALYSKISPGVQSNALQIASRVTNLIAFAFPVFNIERFAVVMPTILDNSFNEIFRLAIMTSKFTIIIWITFI